MFDKAIANCCGRHTLATLRCLAGTPVRGEDYYIADIVVGRAGAEQGAAKREFD